MTLYVNRISKPGKNGLIEFTCETLEEVAKKYIWEHYNYCRRLFTDNPLDVINPKVFELTGNPNTHCLYVTNHRDNIISVGMIISAIEVYYQKHRIIGNWEHRISGTKRWSRRFRYYRRPKTLQERRNNQHNKYLEEGEPIPRASRNNKNLVDSYCDLRRSNQDVKNWKNFRNTQWK